MYEECRHIMPSGRKCHSPALKGKAWCYYHQNLHRYGKPPRFNDNFTYFPIEDARGIQIALTQALAALNSPFMQPRRIGLTLYALQLATQLLKHAAAPEPAESVRVCEETSEGIELAPGKTVCEPPRDCRKCPRQDACSNYEEPPDDEEEDTGDEEDNEEYEEENEEERDSAEDSPGDDDSEDDEDEQCADKLSTDRDESDEEENEDFAHLAMNEEALIRQAKRMLKPPPRSRRT